MSHSDPGAKIEVLYEEVLCEHVDGVELRGKVVEFSQSRRFLLEHVIDDLHPPGQKSHNFLLLHRGLRVLSIDIHVFSVDIHCVLQRSRGLLDSYVHHVRERCSDLKH